MVEEFVSGFMEGFLIRAAKTAGNLVLNKKVFFDETVIRNSAKRFKGENTNIYAILNAELDVNLIKLFSYVSANDIDAINDDLLDLELANVMSDKEFIARYKIQKTDANVHKINLLITFIKVLLTNFEVRYKSLFDAFGNLIQNLSDTDIAHNKKDAEDLATATWIALAVVAVDANLSLAYFFTSIESYAPDFENFSTNEIDSIENLSTSEEESDRKKYLIYRKINNKVNEGYGIHHVIEDYLILYYMVKQNQSYEESKVNAAKSYEKIISQQHPIIFLILDILNLITNTNLSSSYQLETIQKLKNKDFQSYSVSLNESVIKSYRERINSYNEVAEVEDNKDKKCFIATVAYNDIDHPNVILLRSFRSCFEIS